METENNSPHDTLAEMYRSLNALRLEVPAEVADDVREKVDAALAALRAGSGDVEDYAGSDPSIECGYPPCKRRLRRAGSAAAAEMPGGRQFCSKEHRDLAAGSGDSEPPFERWFKESALWRGSDYLWLNRYRDLYAARTAVPAAAPHDETLREEMDHAFEIVAARMMQLLCEFYYEGSPDNWDAADAHEEIRESHPEMAAALQRNWEKTGNSSRAAVRSDTEKDQHDH